MKKLIIALLCSFSFLIHAQDDFLSNELAFDYIEKKGFMSLNAPIYNVYSQSKLTDQASAVLSRIDNASLIDRELKDGALVVTPTFLAKEFITGSAIQGNRKLTYFAVAILEPVSVQEVRPHQSAHNTYEVDAIYKVISLSKFGQALNGLPLLSSNNIKVGQQLSWTFNFMPTSNGFKMDVQSRNEVLLTDYHKSRYGVEAISNLKKKAEQIKNLNSILENLTVGRWVSASDKKKKQDEFKFNEDKTFEYINHHKNETLTGRYSFGGVDDHSYETNIGRIITLIPREGKNKKITIFARENFHKDAMFILHSPLKSVSYFRGDVNPYEEIAERNASSNRAIDSLHAAKLKPKLIGFWKSKNGKSTIEFSEERLTYKTKKKTFENRKWDIGHSPKRNFYLVIFDEKGEIDRQMLIPDLNVEDGKIRIQLSTYYKF